MRRLPLIETAEKESFFCSELVKHGVPYSKALAVAKVIVLAQPDELLTDEDIQLAKTVCREWLEQRQRLRKLHHYLDSIDPQLSK